MLHAKAEPGSTCQGTIRPQWRRLGIRWIKKLVSRCDACGLHFAKDDQGTWVKGMNRAETANAERVGRDVRETNQ